jgi:hypothetical protein
MDSTFSQIAYLFGVNMIDMLLLGVDDVSSDLGKILATRQEK